MQINFQLTEAEYRTFISYTQFNYFRKNKKLYIGLGVLFFGAQAATTQTWSDFVTRLGIIVLFVSIWYFLVKKLTTHLLKKNPQHHLALGQQELLLAHDGLTYTTEMLKTQFQWKSVSEYTEKNDCIYLLINHASTLIVPKRVFMNPEQYAQFKTFIQERLNR